MSFPELESAAREAMTPELFSYVSGGAGDEHTQRYNVTAFERWGLMPRILRGAAQRDLSIELFGRRLDTPLVLAPVGVIGLCDPDGHGDLSTARAVRRDGRPDDRVDLDGGSARGRRSSARRHPRLVPAIPAQRP
ncbi:MAG: alpha-hydroxy-acid oxidizing protein [Microthrixaceae bacterium]